MTNPDTQNSANLARDYSTTVTILEHLSDALFILNAKGQVEYANRVALDMLGLTLKEVLGTPFNSYLNAEFDANLLYDSENPELLLEHIYRGVFSEIETSLVNKDYNTPVVISFGLVRDAQQRVSFIIASAKDITIRKELEKEIQQQQLIALSRDRYKELGELAVNMVHTLSQPITSVRLMLELMEKQVEKDALTKENAKRYFSEIKGLLDTMTTSITNVRNFAFLTEDESLKSVYVEDIIQNALHQLDYEMRERDADIQVHTEKELPSVLANPISLQQVFITLVRFIWDNGLQTEATNGTSTITFDLRSVKGRWLKIVLTNRETGSPDTAGQPQIESAEKPLIGSHLDLTVVQIILTSLGGDFAIKNYANGSMDFILRIPADQGGERDQLRNLIELMHQ